MQNWQIREKHYKDTQAALVKFKCLNAAGNVVKFSGKEIFPEIALTGHDSMDFDVCKCKKENWDFSEK